MRLRSLWLLAALPLLAAVAFGTTLVLVSGLALARVPALAHARPAVLDIALALVLAPLIVALVGIVLERLFLRRIYQLDHLYGLLLTFGIALIIEGVFRNYYGSSGQPHSSSGQPHHGWGGSHQHTATRALTDVRPRHRHGPAVSRRVAPMAPAAAPDARGPRAARGRDGAAGEPGGRRRLTGRSYARSPVSCAVAPPSAQQLDAFVANAVTVGVAGTIALVWGALGVFGAISTSVNYAWVGDKQRSFWKHKLFSFVMLLVAATGVLFGFLITPLSAAAWTFGMFCIHAVIMRNCARFLAEPPRVTATPTWQTRFILLDLLYGLCWMAILIYPTSPGVASSTLMMFMMLLVIAVSSMLAASLPIAALAATTPATCAIALNFLLGGTFDNYILALLAVAAEGYFALLAHRLHSTTLATLEARAEKDALIGELEQAKSISDEARHRAESANVAKSRFLAQMSHELRTPLNAIIGFAEILTNQYFGELSARQLDYSRGILDSSHRLLSLINDILDLATIEAGYMTLETQELDIHTLMSSVLSLSRERARNQNLKLEFDCPTDIGALHGDERRLKQALFNLISHALKFTPAGGTVTLAARRSGERVALIVADTGVGVPREDQARIFEKFERGSASSRQSGTGLGLSLVKSFIELHGGTVEMDSRPGSGTTVTCWLHATPAEAEAFTQTDPGAEGAKRRTGTQGDHRRHRQAGEVYGGEVRGLVGGEPDAGHQYLAQSGSGATSTPRGRRDGGNGRRCGAVDRRRHAATGRVEPAALS